MKWLATTFLCLLTTSATAAQHQEDIKIFPHGLPCTSPVSDKLYENFQQKHGELPMLQGTASLTPLTSGIDVETRMEMFVNPETRSWSIIVFFDDIDTACVLTVGKKLEAFVEGDEI